LDISVRMSETDALGIINNARFFTYMEEGRFDLFRQLNLSYSSNETFIVAKAMCEYLKPGYFGQTLNVETIIKKVGEKSLTLLTYIRNKETGELLAKGEVVIVYYRVDLKQSRPMPRKLKEQLMQNFGDGVIYNGGNNR